jgi:hypothetical protein
MFRHSIQIIVILLQCEDFAASYRAQLDASPGYFRFGF